VRPFYRWLQLAVALDAYILAVGAALLNLFINWGLMLIVDRAKSKSSRHVDS
jgi:hypothetical protein